MESAKLFSKNLEWVEASYWGKLYQSALSLKTYRQTIAGGITSALPDIDILAFNRVVGIGLERPFNASDIDDIIDFYRAAGSKRFFIQLAPFAEPENAHELLVEKGFRYHNNWAKLARPLYMRPENVKETSLTIKRIDSSDSGIFGDIITQSFEWTDELAEMFAASVGLPGYHHYFALFENKPIAASALHIEGEIASMAIAGTLPEYRGIGAQKQLLYHRLEKAWAEGCTIVVSETGEDLPDKPNKSYRNMIKLGFTHEYLRKNYIYEF